MKDEFIGSTFKTPKGGVLTVVGIFGKTKTHNKVYLAKCSICSLDTELYPDGFRSTKGSFKLGQTPCGCAKSPQLNSRQRSIIIKRLLKSENMNHIFVGFVGGEYKTNTTKLICICPTHGEYRVSYANFSNKGSRCSKCGINYTSRLKKFKDPYNTAKSRCEGFGVEFIEFVGGEYINQKTLVLYKCPKHGLHRKSFSAIVNTDSGCPSCASSGYDKSKSGWFYIFEYTKDNDTVYKYGITNRDPDIRSKEHIKGIHNVVSNCVLVKQFEDGNLPLIIESKIKAKYNGVCDWLSSGNTETVTKDNLNDILSIVEDLT
ncbi:hypothetical protein ASswx1_288 [Aeromonas phage Asswx_1]|uniref:CapR homology domain-containing protein n=1 Tax=Aeromonas phage Asswx_1 TaxID=2419739 RepID=A0A411B8H8_9CAUD|nr:hypothetical protein ASswx1_288 [Aeromonas phage Asswx_1]